ncbi:MAG: glycosyltransferase family 4 protein [Thermodesulfobacteriota bacterium]
MNIGLIRRRYTPYGGAEVFLSRFVKGLLKNGHECHLFANEWKEDKNESIVFHHVGILKGISFLKVLSFAVGSYFALKKEPLDVIISFERTLYQDIYRAGDGCHKEWLIQRRKVLSPIGYFLMMLNPLHVTLLLLERRLFQSKRLKTIIANSKRVKKDIIRHYSLPKEKIHVIYNGVNHEGLGIEDKERIRTIWRGRLGISPETILLLFVGSGFKRKGLGFLIEALSLFKMNGGEKIKLMVVGKDSCRKYYRIAKRLGIEQNVIFAGPVREIKVYYHTGDIFVLPSIYEPFSNACLEAMAAGLPVVTSRANGVSEVISHGKDGYIIEDPANPYEIAETIRILLDVENRDRVGEEARSTASRYTIERNLKETLALIAG